MQLTTSDAQRVLKKLNFELVDCKHHVRGFFTVDGKKLFAVHYSFGSKSLPGHVSHLFRKSLHLSEEEFREMVACYINRSGYELMLRERGILP